MRSLILALALATARGAAVKTRTAPRDAAAAFFHNPAATVLHETEAFDAAALPTASEIVRPFAGKFKWPYVDVRRSAEGVTRPTAENALDLVRDEHGDSPSRSLPRKKAEHRVIDILVRSETA